MRRTEPPQCRRHALRYDLSREEQQSHHRTRENGPAPINASTIASHHSRWPPAPTPRLFTPGPPTTTSSCSSSLGNRVNRSANRRPRHHTARAAGACRARNSTPAHRHDREGVGDRDRRELADASDVDDGDDHRFDELVEDAVPAGPQAAETSIAEGRAAFWGRMASEAVQGVDQSPEPGGAGSVPRPVRGSPGRRLDPLPVAAHRRSWCRCRPPVGPGGRAPPAGR